MIDCAPQVLKKQSQSTSHPPQRADHPSNHCTYVERVTVPTLPKSNNFYSIWYVYSTNLYHTNPPPPQVPSPTCTVSTPSPNPRESSTSSSSPNSSKITVPYRAADYSPVSTETLDIHLATCHDRRGKPVPRWVVVLAPSHTPMHVADCSFCHILAELKQPPSPCAPAPTSNSASTGLITYRGVLLQHNRPFDHPPFSTKLATPHKVGIVPRFNRVDILRIAESTLGSCANATQPWARTFLEKLQEGDFVKPGMAAWYMRYCEPVSTELEGLERMLGSMTLESRCELDELIGRMSLETDGEMETGMGS
ncbi:hypothetical protein BDW74DRAFT_181069 [Aspergillus multicolor]|uniref:uncharacterized protein n=1 Tax=Aspergillus multicolor TaxID=41759 RepID=UPI003CCC9273